jgi:hypothetical protein
LIATAPAEPTNWWPGGWTAVSRNWRFGLRGLPGQVEGTNAWPTEDAAHAGRPHFIPADEWTASWSPAARDAFRREVPLDVRFWGTAPAVTTS